MSSLALKPGLPGLLLLATCLGAGCQKDPKEQSPGRDRGRTPGLQAVPAGQKSPPVPEAGRPPGLRIDMDSTEVRVLVVPPGSPAERAGFQAGDVILAAGGREVSNEDELAAAVASAGGEKIFIEAKRGPKLLTLSLASRDPGWMVLSGDRFKGFLLTRAQGRRKIPDLPVGKPIPVLALPSFSGETFRLSPQNPRPLALLFWGTFLPPCYDHLRALARACRGREVTCRAIDTLELFTAVGKTRAFQAELEKVRKTLWPDGPLPIDLFLESQRKFGIEKLPTLLLVDRRGVISARFDGPLADPEQEIPRALDDLLSD